MLELVLSVCLAADPFRCKDVALTAFEEMATPLGCMMAGQPEAVKWIEAHPGWTLRRWTCQPAGRMAKI